MEGLVARAEEAAEGAAAQVAAQGGEGATVVGEPMEFTGWAHDFDKRIIAVEFSLDNGAHWTRYDLEGTTAERWVSWTFAYTPEAPGAYQMKVRSVNEDGDASPIAAVHTFEVL